ncbi:unnamed protein product [Trichobilharzia regenti]|nr:unnamed protein product [Trichobilharzia regenti]
MPHLIILNQLLMNVLNGLKILRRILFSQMACIGLAMTFIIRRYGLYGMILSQICTHVGIRHEYSQILHFLLVLMKVTSF